MGFQKGDGTTYRGLMKSAIEEALTRQIWSRIQAQYQLDASVRAQQGTSPGVVTTDRELYVFGYCVRRLAFLARGDDVLFQAIEKVGYKDFATKFVVFYDKATKGRLFGSYEGEEGRDTVVFPNEIGEFEIDDDLELLDEPLLTIFKTRVRELAN